MKKIVSILAILTLTLALVAGCGSANSSSAPESTPSTSTPSSSSELTKIVVGATPVPHAEILEVAKEVLATKGYELVITEFDDYVQPNMALESGELDANFFQHLPYLEDFNAEKGTKLVSVAAIHYEPLGLYAGKTKAIADLADGATIAVPNDSTNEARALLLLESLGLIKVNPDAGLKATVTDITENPKKLKIAELDAAQIARALPDVDLAVINGNYAIQAGLNAATDALAKEEKDSLAATTYGNIVVVRAGDENTDKTKALVAAIQSDAVKNFITEKYQGSVISIF